MMNPGGSLPIALTELPPAVEPPRKLRSRAEAEKISAVFGRERLELVEGELINKSGKKRPHVNALILLQAWLVQVFGARFVHPEAPIDVAPEDNPSSEPEPDLIVTRCDRSHFQTSNPRPADLELVVEIADTTIGFDLTTKARLYARASIVEYWVLDLGERRMIVHRDPQGGRYSTVVAYSENEAVMPLAAPGSELSISSILPDTL